MAEKSYGDMEATINSNLDYRDELTLRTRGWAWSEWTAFPGGIMKIIYALSLFCAVSITTFSQSGAPNGPVNPGSPFKLEITGNHVPGHSDLWDFENNGETTIKAEAIVEIRVRKTNISERKIDRWSLSSLTDVRDSSGNQIMPKKLDENRIITSGGPGMVRGSKDTVLMPGEARFETYTLSDGFDLKQPGTYTVQFSEHISNDPASALIKSNKITITVLPADNPPVQH